MDEQINESIVSLLKRLWNFISEKILRKAYQYSWRVLGGKLEDSVYLFLFSGVKNPNFSICRGKKTAEATVTIVNCSPYDINIDKISMRITTIDTKSIDLTLEYDDKMLIQSGKPFHCPLSKDLGSMSEVFEGIKTGFIECRCSGIHSWFRQGSKTFSPTAQRENRTTAYIYNGLYNN